MFAIVLETDVAAMFAADESSIAREPLTESGTATIKKKATDGIRANFNSSAGPNGRNWPPRKVEGDGHPLLMDTGALMQAATGGGPGHIGRTEARAIVLGVDMSVDLGGIRGARAHNFGYPPRNLPARPWLGLRREYQDAVAEAAADALLALLE